MLTGKPDAGNPQVRFDEVEQRDWRQPPVALYSTVLFRKRILTNALVISQFSFHLLLMQYVEKNFFGGETVRDEDYDVSGTGHRRIAPPAESVA